MFYLQKLLYATFRARFNMLKICCAATLRIKYKCEIWLADLFADASNLIWKDEKSNTRKLRKKFQAPGENVTDGT